ncbi:hypothetical protein [Gemmata sp.]|uniref:hypothetical protein n=1 Tax=Gemmata sp. TaxID=1914242 RepID=UPI003F70FF2A
MPAPTFVGRIRDRLLGPAEAAPPADETPAEWADRVTAAAAIDQEQTERAYWDAIRAASAGTGTPEAAWAAAQRAGKTPDEFRRDAEQVRGRFEAHAAHAERRPQLEAELARLDAEHRAELAAFQKVSDAHGAKCQDLYDRKQDLRRQVQGIVSRREQAFRSCPYAWLDAAARAVGREVGDLNRRAEGLTAKIRDMQFLLGRDEQHEERNRSRAKEPEADRIREARDAEFEGRRRTIADMEARLADIHRQAAALRKQQEAIEAEQFVP